MKLIITENKLNNVVIKWLNKNYGDLKPYERDRDPEYIFFMKNGRVMFDYNKENGFVYISYDDIWSFLERIFSMEYKQIQEVTKLWVEEHYNLRVTTTDFLRLMKFYAVEEHYNLRVTTTENQEVFIPEGWRNITN
jgi:hypothetical protein